MAYQTYRFAMKSEELRGASQANICRVALNSDADAVTFAANLELVFAADVQTVDSVLRSNYVLPYPSGTNAEARFVMRDAAGHVQTERIYDLVSGFDAVGFSTAIVSSGALIVLPQYSGFGGVVVSVQPAVFVPGQSQ